MIQCCARGEARWWSLGLVDWEETKGIIRTNGARNEPVTQGYHYRTHFHLCRLNKSCYQSQRYFHRSRWKYAKQVWETRVGVGKPVVGMWSESGLVNVQSWGGYRPLRGDVSRHWQHREHTGGNCSPLKVEHVAPSIHGWRETYFCFSCLFLCWSSRGSLGCTNAERQVPTNQISRTPRRPSLRPL